MIRVCPERDTECPHGMDCPYWRNRYSCRAKKTDEEQQVPTAGERLIKAAKEAQEVVRGIKTPVSIWVGPYVDDKGMSWDQGHWDSDLADGPHDQEYILKAKHDAEIAKRDQRIAELEASLKLAHDQYMGCGGNLKSQEIVDAMKRICREALEANK